MFGQLLVVLSLLSSSFAHADVGFKASCTATSSDGQLVSQVAMNGVMSMGLDIEFPILHLKMRSKLVAFSPDRFVSAQMEEKSEAYPASGSVTFELDKENDLWSRAQGKGTLVIKNLRVGGREREIQFQLTGCQGLFAKGR